LFTVLGISRIKGPGIDDDAEITKLYGSRCTLRGLKAHLERDINPNAKNLRAALNRGDDPDTVTLFDGVRDGKPGKGQTVRYCTSCTITFSFWLSPAADNQQFKLTLLIVAEMVRFYGSHCTKNALEIYFRRNLNPNIKNLKQAVEQGQDPKEVVLLEGVRPGTTGKG
jgi:hypothetical protein